MPENLWKFRKKHYFYGFLAVFFSFNSYLWHSKLFGCIGNYNRLLIVLSNSFHLRYYSTIFLKNWFLSIFGVAIFGWPKKGFGGSKKLAPDFLCFMDPKGPPNQKSENEHKNRASGGICNIPTSTISLFKIKLKMPSRLAFPMLFYF